MNIFFLYRQLDGGLMSIATICLFDNITWKVILPVVHSQTSLCVGLHLKPLCK